MVMTCIQVHMCVGLSVLSDTLGFMLSLGLGHTSLKLIWQKQVQAWLGQGAMTLLNIIGNH